MTNSTAFLNDYFPGPVPRDLFKMICGEFIGSGIGRIVFAHAMDPTLVVKIEYASHSFQNVQEWDLWRQHSIPRKTSVAKQWLAPCTAISPCGIVLFQKRTKPIPYTRKLPTSVPAVFNDLKHENWGVFEGRIVCHDYGRHDAVYEASRGKNLVRADWLWAKGGHFIKKPGDSDYTGI